MAINTPDDPLSERRVFSLKSRAPFLAALFFVLVSVPPAVLYLGLSQTQSSATSTNSHDQLSSKAINLQGRKGWVRISGADDLNPLPGKDFLIGVWLRPRGVPQAPQSGTVLSRVSMDSATKEGYSLGLSREGDTLRVSVYWKASSGRGRTWLFPGVPLQPQAWTFLALSFHDGRYLGVHTVSRLPGQKALVRLIGGYDIEESIVPDSKADLLVGTHRAGGYRGWLGGVVLLQSKDLTKDLLRTLKNIGRAPWDFPGNIKQGAVRLWSDDLLTDRGSPAHTLVRELNAGGLNSGGKEGADEGQGEHVSEPRVTNLGNYSALSGVAQ